MIYLKPSYSTDFVEEYIRDVGGAIVLNKLDILRRKVDAMNLGNFNTLFNANDLMKLMTLQPNYLEHFIGKVKISLPIIFHRYNPRLLIEINIPRVFFSIPENARSRASKSLIEQIVSLLYEELYNARNNNNYIAVDYIFHRLWQSNTHSLKLKCIRSVHDFFIGDKWIFDETYMSCFPEWVNELYNVFDYDALSSSFKHKIAKFYDLGYCPYCNDEPIHIIQYSRGATRPALDHFLPRGLYPFLALSLYNLVPTGYRCNTYFKGMRETNDAVNPLVKKHSERRGITFSYIQAGERLSLENISIVLHCNNYRYSRNVKIFELESVYSGREIKDAVIELLDKIDFLRNNGSLQSVLQDYEQLRIKLSINLGKKATHSRWKKILFDVLNQATDSSFNAFA